MLLPRVIPCLLLQSEGLVKTKKFTNASYVGDPINAVKIFNELEVDELVILDISNSKKKKEPNYSHIEQIVSEAFMPVGIGGGIDHIDKAARLINLGVEKVIINSAALTSLSIIESVSSRFGSQSTVLAIDVKRNMFGGYKIFDHRSAKTISKDLHTHIKDGVYAGAGEIFVNDVDNDGLGQGYNCNFINQISNLVNVPIVACGGAGTLEHMYEVVKSGASAAAAGSMFVYKGKHKAVMINYPNYKTIKELFHD